MFGRMLDYDPQHLYQAAYDAREFFEYGGTLFMYPMSELPCWRLHMKHRGQDRR